MVSDLAAFHSDYLIARIPEISYLISSAMMIFASDYLLRRFLIRRLKKQTFIARTSVFLFYGLLVFPVLTSAGAFVLRESALNPFKEWLILMLLVFFFVIGILLSFRYRIW